MMVKLFDVSGDRRLHQTVLRHDKHDRPYRDPIKIPQPSQKPKITKNQSLTLWFFCDKKKSHNFLWFNLFTISQEQTQ